MVTVMCRILCKRREVTGLTGPVSSCSSFVLQRSDGGKCVIAQNRAAIDRWSFVVYFLNNCFFSLENFYVFPQGACYQWKNFLGGEGERRSCKLKHIECLLLDPSSQGINNLAQHFR